MIAASDTDAPPIESHPDGDGTHIDLRLLVAPLEGRFRSVDPTTAPVEGDVVGHGALVGHVEHAGAQTPVRASCRGVIVQVLAEPNDHVRFGQPLAWIRPVSR